jgi:hypothetical protein
MSILISGGNPISTTTTIPSPNGRVYPSTIAVTPTSYTNWNLSVANTWLVPIGEYKMKVNNYNNKMITVDCISFRFDNSKAGVKLSVTGNYETLTMNSLDELREYINRMKILYLKAKEFEKQLNIEGDFV